QEIGEHEVERPPIERRTRRLGAVDGGDGIAAIGQLQLEQPPESRIILDDEQIGERRPTRCRVSSGVTAEVRP
ncbi:MAG TPA: hypothetical protein VIA18_14405, partial [Polyangia bacterium]|nr:hypothetical protein [Polyangia bacterium]